MVSEEPSAPLAPPDLLASPAGSPATVRRGVHPTSTSRHAATCSRSSRSRAPPRAFHLLDEPTPDGRWSVAEYARAPYRTRLLVLRPHRAEDANGTVVVGWQNVSAGYESGAPTHGEMYEGYTWVGVSAQEVGLYGFPAGMERMASRRALPLLEHDPERYGDLHHPGDQAAFDLFTQAGRALAPDRERVHDHAVDPLGGLPVQRLIAAGGSQSAMRLATYLNAIHPTERVFDGFLLSVWEARAPRPEEGVLPMGVRTAIRTDTPTPVVIVNSEFESTHLAQVPCVDTEWLRVWEVAGTPHGNARSRLDEPDRRGRIANPLRYAPVHDAALRALHHWLADGVARAAPAAHRDGPRTSAAHRHRRRRQRARRHPAPRAGDAHRDLSRRGDGHRSPPAVRRGDALHRRRAARPVREPRRVRTGLDRRSRRTGRVRRTPARGCRRDLRERVAEVRLPF